MSKEVIAAYWESDEYWEGIEAVTGNSPLKRLYRKMWDRLPEKVRCKLSEWDFNNVIHPAEETIATIVKGAIEAYNS